MGKKIDLSKKNGSSNFKPNKNTRSFSYPQMANNSAPMDEADPNFNAATIDTASQLSNQLSNMKRDLNKTEQKIEILLKITKSVFFKKILMIGIPVLLGIFALFIGILVLIVIFGGTLSGTAISFGGYYNQKCDEMTVIFVDPNNGYEVTGSQTYSMTDYVAGVVAAEVGGFANKEVYKVYAIAARTFGLKYASDDCSIEGSARRQAFKDITGSTSEMHQLIYEAVRETEGQVIISNNELYPVQYDAFCFISKDSEYYTLSQKNQKIPVSWAQSKVWSSSYLNCPCNANDRSLTQCWSSNGTWQDGGHGRGMSQYGAYYLATEKNYTSDEILEYYYGDNEISISSNSFITSVAGLEIKDTTNASALNSPITTFLISKGSSLDDMNNYINKSVEESGVGTREGVVTAAVSMINYLYDNFNTKLPYYWGGKVSSEEIPSTFGTYSPSSASRGGNIYYYKSFDCSGFVSWAIRKGGYNFTNQSTSGFDANYSKNSCNITSPSCIGQPGDLINSRAGHVELIIAVDEEAGKYFIAHSGGPGVVMQERSMHKSNGGNTTTKIIFMEDFYSNSANVNPNY